MKQFTVGLKLTHDGTVACAEGNQLLFSTEMEKLNNRKRYSPIENIAQVMQVLESEDIDPGNCGFIIDGWKSEVMGGRFQLADYAEDFRSDGFKTFVKFNLEESVITKHRSFCHVTGHIIGSYAMSPFAGGTANVLTWDGGQPLRLDVVTPKTNVPIHQGQLLGLFSYVYAVMGLYYGPYKVSADEANEWRTAWQGDVMHLPGKLMSFCSFGEVDGEAFALLNDAYRKLIQPLGTRFKQQIAVEHDFVRSIRHLDISDENKLKTIHTFIETKLVEVVGRACDRDIPLIFTGGSALNINWNSALRKLGYNLWVPPTPNDTGSAIGQICCANWERGIRKLNWSPFSGPKLKIEAVHGWRRSAMTAKEFGRLINQNPQEAFLCLHGRAEIGPRALGHRSLLMSVEGNKDLLNKIKKREWFRPVAPMVLESEAPKFFSPGQPDPFMLFNHVVKGKPNWAIVHVDGTARVQTVSKKNCPTTFYILEGAAETGLPLLCNTSANENGSGFFDGTVNAARWADRNGVKRMWVEGELWELNA